MYTETSPEAVCLVGMGYVGTSLAAVLADSGLKVRCVDIDEDRVRLVNEGTCPIEEDRITELFETNVQDGNITATSSYDVVYDCPTTLVTVGTPLDKTDPDTSAVEAATESLGPYLESDDTVVFRSTLPAGATEEMIRPRLEGVSGLEAGTDFALAFCPERMAEGNAYDDLVSLPVVVGGYTNSCRQQVTEFWEALGQETVPVSSPTAAELTKLADNWWIDLNIALANEVALLAEKLGVDALEVIRAANTLPKGDHNVNILYPGAGVGGSCLVKDPWFIADLGDKYGLELETPRTSRRVNERMPEHVVDLAAGSRESLDRSVVAVLGYAFKAGTDDTRNTPASKIIQGVRNRGATVRVTDPYVPRAAIEDDVGLSPVRLPEALDGADIVVVVTDHEQYRSLSPKRLRAAVGSAEFTVVDGRFAFDPDDFSGTSIRYLGIGRGEHNE